VTRPPYDLMITLSDARCPKCRSLLGVNPSTNDLTSCPANGCHLLESFPLAAVADATAAYMRRHDMTIDDFRMR
jgi:hypothetical protein